MSYTSTIVITGGSSGLGLALSHQLAKARPQSLILVLSRSPPPTFPFPNIQHLPVDLALRAQVRSVAQTILSSPDDYPTISALVLNAGYQHSPDLQLVAEDGDIEKMFATNHLNQALLFFLLKDRLQNNARIVFVGSSAHDPSKKRVPPCTFDAADPDAPAHPKRFEKENSWTEAMRRYGLSKFCGMLFAFALARHVDHPGRVQNWVVLTYDPGVMASGLYRWLGGLVGKINNWFLKYLGPLLLDDMWTPEASAQSLFKLVIGEQYGRSEMNGKYFQVKDGKEKQTGDQVRDVACQDALWKYSLNALASDATERSKWESM